MRTLPALLLLAACAAEPAADADAPAAPPLGTADLVGTWAFEVMPLDRDTVIVTGTLVGAGDPPVFTMTLTGRESHTSTITVDGDTVRTRTGPYQSAIYDGVMVTTTGSYVVQDGELVGVVTSRYDGMTSGDSVAQYRARMTRVRE